MSETPQDRPRPVDYKWLALEEARAAAPEVKP